MTYPSGRALVWRRALVSVECGAGFVRVCKGEVVHEKSQRAVPAWLALTRVSVVGGHTHISKNKPTAGANSLCGRSKWETVANSPY